MTTLYTFTCKELNEICTLLNKYYGVGVLYFVHNGVCNGYTESDFMYSEDYTVNADNELSIELGLNFNEDFLPIFPTYREYINSKGKTTLKPFDLPNIPENQQVIMTLWLAVFVYMQESKSRKKSHQGWGDLVDDLYSNIEDEHQAAELLDMHQDEWVDEIYHPLTRRDLLELFIFCDKIKRKKEATDKLTIKYGKEKLVIGNNDNWFVKVLLSNHLDKYLPDIKSAAKAQSELNKIKHTGCPPTRPFFSHFIYGTYSMISHHLDKKTVTESMCDIIFNLLELMENFDEKNDKIIDREIKFDRGNIRKNISEIKKAERKYGFDLCKQYTGNEALSQLSQVTLGMYRKMIY